MFRATCFALITLTLVGWCDSAPAQRIEMRLRDLDQGQTLPVYTRAGLGHVEGTPGRRYAIALRNRGAERLLVVLSVDGINVITGQTAATDQAGYVLEPWQQAEIRGWRKSLSAVAEFQFAALPESYAARTGRPDNVGVVGAAVFTERQPVWIEDFKSRDQGASRLAPAAEAASPAQAQQQLGTGHGQRRFDPARNTTFARASTQPTETQLLYYDSREALIAAGILPMPCCTPHRPQPFPLGFVPDPD